MCCERCGDPTSLGICDTCSMTESYENKRKEPGYYWGYNLDSNGDSIQSEDNPDVFFLTSNNEILSCGYDVPLPYTEDNYRLIEKIKFQGAPTCGS